MDKRKVAIVTGAGSGVGEALAHRLADKGVSIVAIGRRAEPLEKLRRDLESRAEVAVVASDITDEGSPKLAVETAMKRFGRLDYLVNNAGVGKPMPVDETDDELLDFFYHVHLRAPFRYCREALKVMADGGAIVNVASTFAVVGGFRGGPYSAMKAGIVGLTKHMAAQYGPRSIRSNVVAPGVLDTPMTTYNQQNPAYKLMNYEMTPVPHRGTADDAASAIAFLLSDEAAFINGQVLMVDGGWSATKFFSARSIEFMTDEADFLQPDAQ